MRRVVAISVAAVLLACLGCTEGRWSFLNKKEPHGNLGPLPAETPSVAALVHYLNENAARTDTLRCDELDMTTWQGVIPVSLRGKMLCQRPRNFRMSADFSGNR